MSDSIRRHGPYYTVRQGLEPMNAALGHALIKLAIQSDPEARYLMARCETDLERLWLSRFVVSRPGGTLIAAQKAIGPYRVDFLINARLVVEIDGYLYHRRTRDQLIYEYERDRYLTTKDLAILHFAGVEVWVDPERCAAVVLDYLAARPSAASAEPSAAADNTVA